MSESKSNNVDVALLPYPVVLIGPPGAGKGTLARAIVEEMGRRSLPCAHISTGDLLRSLPPEHSRAEELRAILASGQFVGDAFMYDLLLERLAKPDAAHVYLLDGFPRTIDQANWMVRNNPPGLVIVLDVPQEVLIQRLSGRRTHLASGRTYNVHDPHFAPKGEEVDDVTGEPLFQRPEDAPHLVRERLELYASLTGRVVEYFEGLFFVYGAPIFLRVDGTRPTLDQLVTVFPWIVRRAILA